jgi:hypothetical protein
MANIIEILTVTLWIGCWFAGGYFLAANALRLPREETTLVGFGVGFVLQAWFANFIGRIMAPDSAFWLSAILVFVAGFLLMLLFKGWNSSLKQFYFPKGYWIAFILITCVFFNIGRGLAIFDDYQNLPTTSMIAAGAIPPFFVLNPEVSFDYHYLMLLISAQWMIIADLFPWTALDLTRAVSLGLALIYIAVWTRRMTKSSLAGWIGLFFVAFAGGVRWLLIYLPSPVVNFISSSIEMIGSGKTSGETFALAMQNFWGIDGVGPIQFPFAFGNGIHSIPVMSHGGTGVLSLVIALLIMLSFGRWKNVSGMILTASLLMAIALVDEIWFVFFMVSSGLVLIYLILQKQTFFGTSAWKALVFMFMPIGVVVLLQGGVLTGVFRSLWSSIFTPQIVNAVEGYYKVGFHFNWPPTIISAHLGRLNLANPGQLLAAIFEVGPIFLVLPLLVCFGIKAFRAKQWLFVILIVGALFSAVTGFSEYAGSAGISASVRLPAFCINLCKLFAVPLCWYWLRNRSANLKMFAVIAGFSVMFGGMFYFGIESISSQRPVLSTFIDPLDASMQRKYWNQLPKDAMVFDFYPPRSVTVFARPAQCNSSWYSTLEEFNLLTANPDPVSINAAGYDYIYWTAKGWNNLSDTKRARFDHPCVVLVEEIPKWDNDFRRLQDISACKPAH